jgi:hypothetical protein
MSYTTSTTRLLIIPQPGGIIYAEMHFIPKMIPFIPKIEKIEILWYTYIKQKGEHRHGKKQSESSDTVFHAEKPRQA